MYFYAHLSIITFSNWSIFTDISFLWQIHKHSKATSWIAS